LRKERITVNCVCTFHWLIDLIRFD
jgi:hypothetical protein